MVAYGVVHLLVAWLAVQVAVGDGADRTDKSGALQQLASGSGGTWLLWLIAVGLGATALWQLYEAFLGHQGVSGGRLGLVRATSLGEAIVFGYLAFSAAKLAGGSAASATDDAPRGLVGRLLAEPYGKAVVVVIGVGVIGIAALVVRHGLRRRFTEHLDLISAGPRMNRAVVRLGQVGYAALGTAYGIAGILVIVAGWQSDPAKATGLDVALKSLAGQSYGPVLLLLIAAGVAAFGVYCLFDARFRRNA
jgi:type IV secretory pathway VirB2 component (pilin)